jgi:hypothetical protein
MASTRAGRTCHYAGGCGLGVGSDWKDQGWKNKNKAGAPRLCAGQAC